MAKPHEVMMYTFNYRLPLQRHEIDQFCKEVNSKFRSNSDTRLNLSPEEFIACYLFTGGEDMELSILGKGIQAQFNFDGKTISTHTENSLDLLGYIILIDLKHSPEINPFLQKCSIGSEYMTKLRAIGAKIDWQEHIVPFCLAPAPAISQATLIKSLFQKAHRMIMFSIPVEFNSIMQELQQMPDNADPYAEFGKDIFNRDFWATKRLNMFESALVMGNFPETQKESERITIELQLPESTINQILQNSFVFSRSKDPDILFKGAIYMRFYGAFLTAIEDLLMNKETFQSFIPYRKSVMEFLSGELRQMLWQYTIAVYDHEIRKSA
jgi:hypothetical protein